MDATTAGAWSTRDAYRSGAAEGGPIPELVALARRRIRLIATSVGIALALAGAYLALVTPTYRATAEILIDPQALQVVGRGLTRTDTAASIDFANIDSQALVLASTSLLQRVIADLGLEADPVLNRGRPGGPATAAIVLEALRTRLVVRRVDNSLVFQVTASHPDAEAAARIANAVASAYFKLASQDRTNAVNRAASTLVEQSTHLREELIKADADVERFKVKEGLISTGESGLIVSQQLKDLYAQISATEASLPRLAARRGEMRALSAAQLADGAGGATPEALTSPVIGALRAQYAGLAQTEAQLAGTLGANHPDLAAARQQRKAVLQQIQLELNRILRATEEEHRRAEQSLAGLRKRAESLTGSQIASNEAEIRLRQLESEASAIRTVYTSSLGRVKELQQQGGIETNASRIISEATVPLRPAGAMKALVLAAALLFGAVAGFALAYAIEFVRGVVPGAGALAAVAGAPVVAELSGGPSPRSDADERALAGLADDLHGWLGGRLPAVIAVSGWGLEPARIADALAAALRRRGETVLRCTGGLGDGAPTAARHAGALRAPIARAGVKRPPEIVVVDVPSEPAEAALGVAALADAVLVVAEPGRVTRREVADLLAILDRTRDKRRRGLLGLVRLRPARPVRTPRGVVQGGVVQGPGATVAIRRALGA